MSAVGVLLDTSVVIATGREVPARFEDVVPAVSAITVAELAYGLDVDEPVERRARTDRFYALLEDVVVLDFGVGPARAYGTLAALVRRGRTPSPSASTGPHDRGDRRASRRPSPHAASRRLRRTRWPGRRRRGVTGRQRPSVASSSSRASTKDWRGWPSGWTVTEARTLRQTGLRRDGS